MIDLTRLEQYRENNRIEAKKALGGLPHSIWETYSAFANTLGGIILLGAVEYKDKSLHTVDLPDPERLVKEFWELVNDPAKASVNILTSKHVRIEEVNGDHIIVIEVPRAPRYCKPVYVDGDPVSGTYRRSGEGDYHCSEEELRAMYRDADIKTQDMLILENMDSSVFCAESIRAYRQRLNLARPNNIGENLDDDEFLMKLGATGIGEDGKVHPSAAGLLMFGYAHEIVREYPQYCLDYREEYDDRQLTERLISSSGDWSGNVFDFYFHVYEKIQRDLQLPFKEGASPADDTAVHKAIREALTNCLINADYYGRRGVVIVRKRDRLTVSNPGEFRFALAEAKTGGRSDPRNGVLMMMFNLIDVGERAGHGIPDILLVWKRQGWAEPTITQSVDPNRVMFSLPFSPAGDKKPAIKPGGKKRGADADAQKEMIIQYLTDHASAQNADIAELLDLKPSRAEVLLSELVSENIVISEGDDPDSVYKLKA